MVESAHGRTDDTPFVDLEEINSWCSQTFGIKSRYSTSERSSGENLVSSRCALLHTFNVELVVNHPPPPLPSLRLTENRSKYQLRTKLLPCRVKAKKEEEEKEHHSLMLGDQMRDEKEVGLVIQNALFLINDRMIGVRLLATFVVESFVR